MTIQIASILRNMIYRGITDEANAVELIFLMNM